MTQATLLDRTHHVILETFVSRGQAPHHTEIAASLGFPPEEGRRLLHVLVGTGMPVWLQPGTDLIASCAPFNEVPTPYRASVDGSVSSRSRSRLRSSVGSGRPARTTTGPGRAQRGTARFTPPG